METSRQGAWTHSLDSATRNIRYAYRFGQLSGTVTLLMSIAGAMGMMQGYGLWNLIDVVIIFSFTIWIGRRSRVAATLMFGYAVANMTFRLVGEGQLGGALLSFVGIYFYFRGMVGTYRHHTLSLLERISAETDEPSGSHDVPASNDPAR
jgi:hypothetical protein